MINYSSSYEKKPQQNNKKTNKQNQKNKPQQTKNHISLRVD